MRTDETVHLAQAPAPQVEVHGRLRVVRQRGLHPRSREPVAPQGDPRHRVLHVQHGQPGRHSTGLGVPGARRRPAPARVRADAADAGPGRGRGLHDPRLPARVQADLGRTRRRSWPPSTARGRCRPRARSWAPASPPSATSAPASATSRRSTAFVRIQQVAAFDPEICLLEQGLPCNGPATRNGCGALCPAVAAPVHRLLRRGRGRRRLRRPPDVGLRLGHRGEQARGDRQGARRHPRPGGPVLPLQPGGSLLRSGRSAWQNDGE